MTSDQERWAEALQIENMFGEDAPAWIAQRIATLAIAGDAAGVERFRQIAACFEEMLTATRTAANSRVGHS